MDVSGLIQNLRCMIERSHCAYESIFRMRSIASCIWLFWIVSKRSCNARALTPSSPVIWFAIIRECGVAMVHLAETKDTISIQTHSHCLVSKTPLEACVYHKSHNQFWINEDFTSCVMLSYSLPACPQSTGGYFDGAELLWSGSCIDNAGCGAMDFGIAICFTPIL